MCNRTGFVNNPNGDLFSTQQHFPIIIKQNKNIDILILWIGTNDLQFQYDITIEQIETGLKQLISLSREKTNNIIIIPPVKLDNRVLNGYFNIFFNETSIKKSIDLDIIYKEIAHENNCFYFDINAITTPCDIDGLHYDTNSQKIIADELTKFITEKF
jgi:lysophospholipase L1-like esterase